jgi:predicted dehydrogenase
VERFLAHHDDLFALDIDAVVVATPPETHFPIARAALEHDLDVLVEKPLATSSTDATALVELADARERVLMVGHTFVYNPAVRMLKSIVDGDELGAVRYIDSVRVSLGNFHPRLNTVWDLAPHDISIFIYLLGESPCSVSTHGVACVHEGVEDVAYMTLAFPSGILAHSRMSWLDPCKTRRTTVVGSSKMAVYDDLESHEKVRIYDKNVNSIRRTDTYGDFQFAYHYGSVVSPFIHFEEPLRLECEHFARCLETRERPLTDGRNGVQVVKVIEAAQRSLQASGIVTPTGLGAPGVPELDVARIRKATEPRVGALVGVAPEPRTAEP